MVWLGHLAEGQWQTHSAGCQASLLCSSAAIPEGELPPPLTSPGKQISLTDTCFFIFSEVNSRVDPLFGGLRSHGHTLAAREAGKALASSGSAALWICFTLLILGICCQHLSGFFSFPLSVLDRLLPGFSVFLFPILVEHLQSHSQEGYNRTFLTCKSEKCLFYSYS